MSRAIAVALKLVLLAFIGQVAAAQIAGIHDFGTYIGGPVDAIDAGNLNAHIVIPIRHKAGRAIPFAYDLTYDSTIWMQGTVMGSPAWVPTNGALTYWGWGGLGPVFSPYLSYSVTMVSGNCFNGTIQSYQEWSFSNFVYHDAAGIPHFFSVNGQFYNSPGGTMCPPVGQVPTSIPTSNSGDGFTLSGVSLSSGSASGTLTDNKGTTYTVPWLTSVPSLTSPFTGTDRNGNKITETAAVYTDTLGTTVLSASGVPPANTTFTYIAPSGSSAHYTVGYHAYTVTTNFGCTGINEYSQTGINLVDYVALPDDTPTVPHRYTFTYELTSSGSTSVTGRLASVTLPTGGSITYMYSNGTGSGSDAINCTDGTAMKLTRTVSPGGTWTYTRSLVGSPAGHSLTTVRDPTAAQNETVMDFMQDYQTQSLVYQGLSSGGGTLLSTTIICYNTASPTPASCPTGGVTTPISRRTVFTYLPASTGLQAEADTQYFSGAAFPSQVDSYDYGSGAVGSLLRSVVSSYSIFGSDVLPTSVVVKDGAGTTKASITYSYDQVAVTTTTGTPNHTSVTGARGNLTQIATQVSGTGILYRRFTYYDTGTMNTSTDAGTTSSGGPNTTTYNYASGSSCGNSFVTSISEPLSLSRSMAYDSTCAGGVLESVTDENSKTASIAYTDPTFWRPASSTDQLSNVANFTYPTISAVESSMLFNSGGSVVDHRTTVDGFGRTIINQTLQGPGATSYDTSETDYDVRGAFVKGTQPYSAASGTLCTGTCPGTSATYDALGRTLTATDAGGGTSTLSYTKNDTLQTLGPAPTGENTKRKQFEYDGLGRLSSVCEITSGTGSGTCGQTVTQTGFWTKYTYDTLGDLTGVTQNAQATSQSRTYVFDMIGRLTSETNPETGTTTYAYDALSSDPSCGTVTSAGDLLKKVDAIGNVTCFAYDALHRTTSLTYPTGTYAASTPIKKFVYDSATVNSIAMSNAKTRLAEAYTCTGTCTSKITDLGFSYSARGEVTDVLESTPNSGGYYHVTNAYWANGALNTLSGIPGVPTLTYAADGEGRVNTVSAASGQNPVTATSYNTASQVTGVTFGSSDNDAYTFDPNTGRMTQYKFNVGSGSGSTPTLVQHTNKDAGTTTSSTLAFVSNNTAGNWIGVCIRAGASGETFTISDSKGNTYHQAFSINDTVGGNTLAIYYAENIGSGANTVTVADSISGTLRFAILEYSGVATSSSLDVTASATGHNASASSGSATTTVNGDLLLGAIMNNAGGTFTAGTGFTIHDSVPASGTKLISEDQIQTTAGVTSASATLGATDTWAAGLAAFKAASSGPQSLTGNLTWNANGTLQTLGITDQLNSANTQSCAFGYDDMTRITGANCGATWTQTFSLDPFGNLSKSGSASFLPTYATSTNRFSSIPGGTVTYDSNGNLTNDVGHSYTWDADGNTVSVDGSTVTMIYDAFDRMIEQTRGANHTQILYSPLGTKLALMNATTLVKAFVSLPTGAKAVYTSAGLAYYRHADHLGSSRLATTSTRTMYFDVAYAPYGEDYSGSGTPDLSFTGQNQDTVGGGWSTGLDDFMFREYRPSHGRWTSPDPAGLSAVNPANPQSWNRYAYVSNNPLSAVDPLGLEECNNLACTSGSGGSSAGDPGPTDDGGGFGYGGAAPVDGGLNMGSGPSGGASVAACGVNPFCIAAGGVGPFGSPVARGFSWANTTITTQGIYIDGTIQTDYYSQEGDYLTSLISLYVNLVQFSSVAANAGTALDAANNGTPNCISPGVCKSPIDKLNLMEIGKTNYRDPFSICSTHTTVDNSTGATSSHVDLFNPGTSIPTGPMTGNVPALPFHLIFDALPDAIYRVTGQYLLPAGRGLCQ